MTDRKLEAEAARIRAKIKAIKEQATFAELVTEYRDHPMWTGAIRPVLRNAVAAFHDAALSMDPKDFAIEQAIAKWCAWLESRVESQIGKRDELLTEAARLESALEAAQKEGRIKTREHE